MTEFYDRLVAETAPAREGFISIPVIQRAVRGDVPRDLYADYLTQAYHHVRHTCPLLHFAAARTEDNRYRDDLLIYLKEEQGHDDWILDDIAAITGAKPAPLAPPSAPCRAMVGYTYYAIEWISPYAFLGMVHVLEGMSALLASRAAQALQTALGSKDGRGFLYLTSHGALDVDHVAFFRDLVNRREVGAKGDVIIECANTIYWLYGNIFHDLEQRFLEKMDVAVG